MTRSVCHFIKFSCYSFSHVTHFIVFFLLCALFLLLAQAEVEDAAVEWMVLALAHLFIYSFS
jgi:hypothetical protein